jgi:hypothetical protein
LLLLYNEFIEQRNAGNEMKEYKFTIQAGKYIEEVTVSATSKKRAKIKVIGMFGFGVKFI